MTPNTAQLTGHNPSELAALNIPSTARDNAETIIDNITASQTTLPRITSPAHQAALDTMASMHAPALYGALDIVKGMMPTETFTKRLRASIKSLVPTEPLTSPAWAALSERNHQLTQALAAHNTSVLGQHDALITDVIAAPARANALLEDMLELQRVSLEQSTQEAATNAAVQRRGIAIASWSVAIAAAALIVSIVAIVFQ